MLKKLKDRKGSSATVIIVVILVVALFIIGLYIKLNWRTFKAEASFGFAIAMLIVFILLLIFVLIKHSLIRSQLPVQDTLDFHLLYFLHSITK